jgi:hypothetical protein
MKKQLLASSFLLVWLGGCGPMTAIGTPQVYYPLDAVQEYTERSDKLTLSAGNAQEVNARIHEVDPWPPYVADRRIPMNGARAVKAVQCYESNSGSQTGTTAQTSATAGGSSSTTGPAGCPSAPLPNSTTSATTH